MSYQDGYRFVTVHTHGNSHSATPHGSHVGGYVASNVGSHVGSHVCSHMDRPVTMNRYPIQFNYHDTELTSPCCVEWGNTMKTIRVRRVLLHVSACPAMPLSVARM